MKRVNIRMTDELYDYYKAKSEKTGLPYSAFMIMALENSKMAEEMSDNVLTLKDIITEMKSMQNN